MTEAKVKQEKAVVAAEDQIEAKKDELKDQFGSS
jgi:hypothetical protein